MQLTLTNILNFKRLIKMKKITSSLLAIAALSAVTTSALASDYSDQVRDIKISVSALENQLKSMDVEYHTVEIESGLNRSQEVRALEAKYSSLQDQFNNAQY
jgi:hypothetical protein